MARYDGALEDHLRALFRAVGTSSHDKTRYFDYMNNLFTLHKLFLQTCEKPELPLTEAERRDLERYTGDCETLVRLLSQRLSGKARGALAGQTEQLQPQKRRGLDETL